MQLPGLFAVPDWIVFVVTAAALLYMYAARYRNYWESQNVPAEPLSLIFRPFLQLITKPLHVLDQERLQIYGKVFGTYEGGKPMLFVAEPEMIKKVLVKDFVTLSERRRLRLHEPLMDDLMTTVPLERWRKIRPTVSPAFTTGKLKKMTAIIEDCARITRQHLQKAAEKYENIEMKHFFGNFTLDIIARCAFGTYLDSQLDQSNEFLSNSKRAIGQGLNIKLILFALFPWIFHLLKISPVNMDAFNYFKSLAVNVMKQRKEKNIRNEDFLQLMMDAQEGKLSAATESTKSSDDQLYHLGDEGKPVLFSSDKTLTENEAIAQSVLFLFAGQDTMASVVSFTLYLLALHQEVQDKLREEVNECFAKHDNRPSFDVVHKQKYLNAVLSESLRMFPPASRAERTATEPYTVDGITVPEGCVVAVPLHAIHHDPQNFPDPEKFDPERFSEENLSSIRPYTYLPFGAGPRNCVGMRFALHVVKLCLMNVIYCAKFVRTSETQVPLTFVNGSIMLNAKEITVGVRPLHAN